MFVGWNISALGYNWNASQFCGIDSFVIPNVKSYFWLPKIQVSEKH